MGLCLCYTGFRRREKTVARQQKQKIEKMFDFLQKSLAFFAKLCIIEKEQVFDSEG